VSSSEKVLWAPAVLSLFPAVRPGLKGRPGPGQGVPFGPESIVKELVVFCV
jgi:hypothetical protein